MFIIVGLVFLFLAYIVFDESIKRIDVKNLSTDDIASVLVFLMILTGAYIMFVAGGYL